MNSKKKILVTGACGFIGFHLCKRLIQENNIVIGLDNMNSYYDQELKQNRLKEIESISKVFNKKWFFYLTDIENIQNLKKIFMKHEPDIVINLAAQAGVRFSIDNPNPYISSNISGFSQILECCRIFKIKNFIYASSSSVYGGNAKYPFSEKDPTNHPVSLYAATKRANELIAHSYSHLFGIPSIGLRFFTVYGPWGRPDMAPMLFAKAILDNEPIKIFNYGEMERDFTYIDDVIEIIFRLLTKPALSNPNFRKESPDPSTSWAPHKLFNVGNSKPINILKFIEILEKEIGKKAKKIFEPMQDGDVEKTYADTKSIKLWTDWEPKTSVHKGVNEFVIWYKKYFKK